MPDGPGGGRASERRELELPSERLWGSLLSLAERASVALLAANVGTDRSLCLHLPLPAPFAPMQNHSGFGKDPQEECSALTQPVSWCLNPSSGLFLCPGTPWQVARRSPDRAETVRETEQANLAMPRGWTHDTTHWCCVCCQLHVSNAAPAQGAANSSASLALLPHL